MSLRGHRHCQWQSHLEDTFAQSCEQQSFMQKYKILQANIIFLHKNLYIRIIFCIFAVEIRKWMVFKERWS